MKLIDLTGKTFGRLTVVGRGTPARAYNGIGTMWCCTCTCGNSLDVTADALKKGSTQSCGCLAKETRHAKLDNLFGERFGMLTVIKRGDFIAGNRGTRWVCKCDCGNFTTVFRSALKRKKSPTRSCGCATGALISENKKLPNRTRNGKRTPEYNTWKGIKARCLRETGASYVTYGAKGITMYDGWINDFDSFFAHVGTRPSPEYTLDRIDVTKGYEPGNVRWADWETQANNKTTTRYIEWQGRKQSVTQWSRELFGRDHLIAGRLRRGWPIERAFTEAPFIGKNQTTRAI